MTILRILAFSVVFALVQSASLRAEEPEPARKQGFSKHINDAIQAGFRKSDPDSELSAPDPIETLDVEPGVVALPAFQVTEQKLGPVKLSPNEVMPKTEAIPLKLGTGVTEFRGKKFTVLTRKVLFIPIAWKIAW